MVNEEMLDTTGREIGKKYIIRRRKEGGFFYNGGERICEVGETLLVEYLRDYNSDADVILPNGNKGFLVKEYRDNGNAIDETTPYQFKKGDKVTYIYKGNSYGQKGTVIECHKTSATIDRDNPSMMCGPASTESFCDIVLYIDESIEIKQKTQQKTQLKVGDKVRYIGPYNTHPELDILTIKRINNYYADVEETSNRHPCLDNLELVRRDIVCDIKKVCEPSQNITSAAADLPTPTVELLTPLKQPKMNTTETNVRNLLRDRYFKKEGDKVLTLIETSETTMAKLHKFNKAIKHITNETERLITSIEYNVKYNDKAKVIAKVAELNKFLADFVETADMKAMMTAMGKALTTK